MNSSNLSLSRDATKRVQDHFDDANAEDVVRNSQQLILYPNQTSDAVVPTTAEGPILVHPRPRRVPLSAYLASALTGLDPTQKALVVHLSDIVCLVCRSVDIDLYEPRKKTDPVHHTDVSDVDVFKIDRERVLKSDL